MKGDIDRVYREERERRRREGDKVWRREEDGEKLVNEGGEEMRRRRRGWVRDRAMRIKRGRRRMRVEASETRRGIEQTRVDSDMRVSRKPVTPRFPWQRQAINQPATSPSTVR